jgi:hypothetical protein
MCEGRYEEPLSPSAVCTAEGLTGVDGWSGDVRHWHLHKGLDCVLLKVEKDGWVPGLPPAIWGECDMVGDWGGGAASFGLGREGHQATAALAVAKKNCLVLIDQERVEPA